MIRKKASQLDNGDSCVFLEKGTGNFIDEKRVAYAKNAGRGTVVYWTDGHKHEFKKSRMFNVRESS